MFLARPWVGDCRHLGINCHHGFGDLQSGCSNPGWAYIGAERLSPVPCVT